MASQDEDDISIFSPYVDPRLLAPRRDAARRLRGVITDWGGVMTRPIIATVTAWLTAESIDPGMYRSVMRSWVSQAYGHGDGRNPIHALERGECTEAEFEAQLAAQLVRTDGGPVPADGLLGRMFAASAHDEGMHELIRAVRRAGLRTGLLSNSWGGGYPRDLFPDLFDAVVISSEVGLRKPEPEIFLLAAEVLGLAPEECAFIDDVTGNVTAAQEAGLTAIHHIDTAQTAALLSELLGVELPPPAMKTA